MTSKKPTPSQMAEICAMLANGEYDRDFAQAIIGRRVMIKPDSTPFRGDVAGSGGDLKSDHFNITVESTAAPTYAELKAAYDWVSDAWDESKYKLELYESLREVTPSTGDKVVFVKKFDRATKSEKAIEWGKSHGYRLAFPVEREAFSKANPDLQRKFWIVDCGSFIVLGVGHRSVPVLHVSDDGERDLGHHWFDYEWSADYRFLFVRE